MANDETITGTPMVEEIVELGLRRAIRDAINAAGFEATRISCYWLGHEESADESKAMDPPFVFIQASPSTATGPGEPFRNMSVDIMVVTLPDEDAFAGDKVMRNLYKAVRSVFDPGTLTFDSPVVAGGHWVESASIDPAQYFSTVTLTVKLVLSVS